MSQLYRRPEGGRIDRSRTIHFTFDGRLMAGHPGDTLASALLANGVHLVGRSFKYHRPRGILSAGAEEPNALVQVGDGPARTDPNQRATQVELIDGLTATSQNRWPSLGFDIGAANDLLAPLFPSGFYYKTFMWPARLWPDYEHVIRHAAGLGRSPAAPDPDRYDQRYAFCDVLVIGAGPAGLAAALEAGRSGARVILADEQAEFGGCLLSEPGTDLTLDGAAPAGWIARARAELDSLPEVTLLPRTTVFGYYHGNSLGLLERVTDHLPPGTAPAGVPRQRFWKVRAKRVVLATGAIERPLIFPDNDRPGTILAASARSYLTRYAVEAGQHPVIVTNNDSAYRAALDLHRAGRSVEAIVDLRPDPRGPLADAARAAGLRILAGHTVAATEGRKRIAGVTVRPLDGDGTGFGAGKAIPLHCDLLAVSGGWNPAVHLFSQSRGKLVFDPEAGSFVPGRAFQPQASAGGCNGATTVAEALAQGAHAGREAAAAAGFVGLAGPLPAVTEPALGPQRTLWLLPAAKPHRAKAFVDLQNDVTAKDLKLAVREGYRSVEHVKRYTTTGMGTDQGKTGNVTALGIVAGTLGLEMARAGVTTFRPPYTAVPFGALAGRNVKRFLAPARRTPMHEAHVRAGAAFENVGGQWQRAWYYPQPGEDMQQAVRREALAARCSVGILDASTLGKIDIQGPDAAEFLNRVYTNAWLKLGIGRCRYGLMLGEDGMVRDDGVTTRLSDSHFHMTTTTGGAAGIMGWLEEWHQTEWPDLKVHLTSVTEQWAVMAISGPNSRKVLAKLTDDIDLAADAFPFMSMRTGHVAGVPARVFRISFTGELSYEVNVPASYGLAVWDAAMAAGAEFDIAPYGTETMHLLRAEKGFIIVGQETDGTVTPFDLGMGGMVAQQKDFIGKRSLFRADMQRPDRKHLVGLLTRDPALVLEEGAHLIATAEVPAPPVPMLGHVTSAYASPTLGRSIALALVKGGRERMGQTLFVATEDGRTVPVTVTDPVFLAPEGARQNV